MGRILVTGALGQIGTELVPALRARHGTDAVVASDLRELPPDMPADGPFEALDVTNAERLRSLVDALDVDTIYHLASLLSAIAERQPQRAWAINMGGLLNVLELGRDHSREGHPFKIFVPSSIAAFGPGVPTPTPQVVPQRPTSMYGVTKVAGELLCDYYFQRYGVDTRGLRYPGLISSTAPPGGGTTDYAVDIFHQAVDHGRFTCFLEPDTRLDMMYMPDAIRAMLELMAADGDRLVHRNAYNVTAFSITPAELADAIRRHLPDFTIDYEVDPVRQAIAESWPDQLEQDAARDEWGWRPAYDLEATVAEMLRAVAGARGERLDSRLETTPR